MNTPPGGESAPATASADSPDWTPGRVAAAPAVLFLFQLLPLAVAATGARPALAGTLALAATAGILTIGWVAYALCYRRGKSLRSLGLRPPVRTFQLLTAPLAGALASLLLLELSQGLYGLLTGGESPPPQRAAALLSQARDPLTRGIAALTVGLIAPGAEEIVFRGVLYRALRLRLPLAPALGLSAAVFSLAHMDTNYFLHIFGLGLILGAIVERSRSLYPAMILHALNNAAALATLWR